MEATEVGVGWFSRGVQRHCDVTARTDSSKLIIIDPMYVARVNVHIVHVISRICST